MHPEGEKTRENPKGAKPTRDFPEFFHPKGAIISRIMSPSPCNVIITTWQEIKLNRQGGLGSSAPPISLMPFQFQTFPHFLVCVTKTKHSFAGGVSESATEAKRSSPDGRSTSRQACLATRLRDRRGKLRPSVDRVVGHDSQNRLQLPLNAADPIILRQQGVNAIIFKIIGSTPRGCGRLFYDNKG